MTTPTPYTDDNVKRLAEWAHLPGVTNVSEDRQVALNLLRRGVTLPPEPDTPPEPQERYYVGDGQYDNKVYERGRAHVYAETYLTLDADRIARLLNLDAKYEGGIEAEVERLQDKASARAVKAAELALEDARAELIREREDRGLERDLFAARVKELETERLGATTTTTELTDDDLQHWLTTLMVRWGKEGIVERLNDRFPPTTNQPVTAVMVRRVLGESGALAVAADQGLSPFDVADRLNGLLGRTPHRPEDR